MNYNELIETKPQNSYTQDQIASIKLLSANKKKLAVPFGSTTYRAQPFPSDFDLVETFQGKGLKEVVTKFEKKLQEIVHDIVDSDKYIFSELKSGQDFRYDIDRGKVKDGKFTPRTKHVLARAKHLYENGLFTKKEYDTVKKILAIKNPKLDDYLALAKIFTDHRKLRWTADEVLKGEKKLPGGVKVKLVDTLAMREPVKIDVITMLDGMLTEVTNFYKLVFSYEEGLDYPINQSLSSTDEEKTFEELYTEGLQQQIEEFFQWDRFYSPFKAVKRMWAFTRFMNLEKDLLALTPLATGNVSLLYQQRGIIATMLRLYELGYDMQEVMDGQINKMKQKIANILFIPQEELECIYDEMDKFIFSDKIKTKKDILEFLEDCFTSYINTNTIKGLNEIGFNPPPNYYFPVDAYSKPHARKISDKLINPLKKYGFD